VCVCVCACVCVYVCVGVCYCNSKRLGFLEHTVHSAEVFEV
jgi:hypothetical protein